MIIGGNPAGRTLEPGLGLVNAVRSGRRVPSVVTVTPGPNIGGAAIGSIGSGSLAGYYLADGIDFTQRTISDGLLQRPGVPYPDLFHNFGQRDRDHTSATSVHTLSDLYSTGWRDANDGAVLADSADLLTCGPGGLTMKVRPATAAEIAAGGTRDNSVGPSFTNRPMVAAHPSMFGLYATKGPGVTKLDFTVVKPSDMSSGDTAQLAIAVWFLDLRGGSEQGSTAGSGNWPNEMDLFEYHLSNGQITARPSGSGSSQAVPPSAFWAFDGTEQQVEIERSATQIRVRNYNVDGSQRSLEQVVSNSAGNFAEGFYMMFGIFTTTPTFDLSRWTGKQATLNVKWIREYLPTGVSVTAPKVANAAPLILNYGQGGSYTYPSQQALWGRSDVGEYIKFLRGRTTNGPGGDADQATYLDTRDAFPAEVAANSSTRTLSFTNAFAQRPGVYHCFIYGLAPEGGVHRPHKLTVYVKPKVSLPAFPAGTIGQPYSFTLPRVDGSGVRYWDNGNCPNIAAGNHGLSLASAPAAWAYDPATNKVTIANFTGAASLTFRCTNGAGLFTEQTIQVPIPSTATVFMQDSFTDTDGVALTAHTGELGATWVQATGFSGNGGKIAAGRLYNGTANAGVYRTTTVAPSADYYVEAVISFVTTNTTSDAAVCGRMAGGSNTLLFTRYNKTGGVYELYKVLGGTATQLGTFAAAQPTGDVTLRLTMAGANISVQVNGVSVIAATLAQSDLDGGLAGPGYPGVRSTVAATATTGVQFNSILAAA